MTEVSLERVDEDNFEDFFRLIVELATFEKLTPPDEAAKQRLKAHALMANPYYEGYVARIDDEAVAYLILTTMYSSFLAKPTLYVEDVFVTDSCRGLGIGRELFRFSAQRAEELGCGRMEWHALDWNSNAHRFYQGMGAKQLPEWLYFRLDEEGIKRLGRKRE